MRSLFIGVLPIMRLGVAAREYSRQHREIFPSRKISLGDNSRSSLDYARDTMPARIVNMLPRTLPVCPSRFVIIQASPATGDRVAFFQHVENFCGLVADGTSARRNSRRARVPAGGIRAMLKECHPVTRCTSKISLTLISPLYIIHHSERFLHSLNNRRDSSAGRATD